MEDNLSQDATQHFDHLASVTPAAISVRIVPRSVDVDLQNVSLTENDDYLSDNLSHIHLLHATANADPTLNAHETTLVGHHDNSLSSDLHDHQRAESMLQFFTQASDERLQLNKSKSIQTPSTSNPTLIPSYDPNHDMSFLCDLMTPPSSSTIQQPSIPPQFNQSTNHNFFEDHWTG